MNEKHLSITDICINNFKRTYFFYRCTMHYGICILFTHQQLHFLLNLEKFKFTLEYTQLSLLHVSVFNHPEGACTDSG